MAIKAYYAADCTTSVGNDKNVALTSLRTAISSLPLKQEVPLGHREDVGGLASEQFPIGPDFIGFGVDLHVGLIGVELHVGFADAADGMNGFGWFLQANLGRDP